MYVRPFHLQIAKAVKNDCPHNFQSALRNIYTTTELVCTLSMSDANNLCTRTCAWSHDGLIQRKNRSGQHHWTTKWV